MDEKKNTVTVRINGADYTIVTTAEAEYVQRIAYYVDKKMVELMSNDKRLSTALAAVLTSINVADDYFRVQSDNEKLRGELLKYADESGDMKSELNNLTQENKALRDELQSLKITLARMDTELKQYKNNGYNNKR